MYLVSRFPVVERIIFSSRSTVQRLSSEKCIQLVNEFLAEYPVITHADYCRLTGLDKKHALQDLNRIIEEGVLRRFGGGK